MFIFLCGLLRTAVLLVLVFTAWRCRTEPCFKPIRFRPGTTARSKKSIHELRQARHDAQGDAGFVTPAERIAVFDDGALW